MNMLPHIDSVLFMLACAPFAWVGGSEIARWHIRKGDEANATQRRHQRLDAWLDWEEKHRPSHD